jgi:hypothetical protein
VTLPPGLAKLGTIPALTGITNRSDDDGNGGRRAFRHQRRGGIPGRKNQVHLAVHELVRQWRQAFGLSGIAILEGQPALLDVVKISLRPAERVEAWPLAAYQTQHADAGRLAHRLASGGERRKKKAEPPARPSRTA